MLIYLLLVACIAPVLGVTGSLLQQGVEGENHEGYRLVWQDLFDGDTLDESVWNVEVNGNGGGNKELQYYRRENVTISREPKSGKSCLTLTVRREPFEGKAFTSGRVNTNKKKSFAYGRVEASICLPKTANGLWPAFWLLGNNFNEVGWPRCGEIDILEMGNHKAIANSTQERYFNGACHWGVLKGGSYPNYAKFSDAPYSLQDGDFHLYTLVWNEQRIDMYLDLDRNPSAEPYFSMSIADVSEEMSAGHYFHHDFFILFNLAVGGNYPRIWEPDGITAVPEGESVSMYVDFVRVYQK